MAELSAEEMRQELEALRSENAALKAELAALQGELTVTAAKLEEAASRPLPRQAIPNPFERGMSPEAAEAICREKGWSFGLRDNASQARGLMPGAQRSRGTVTLPTGERALLDFQDGRLLRVQAARDEPYPF